MGARAQRGGSWRHRTCAALLTLVAGASPALQAQVPATSLERKAAVERSLLPAVEFMGQASQGYTLAARMRHYGVPGASVAVIHKGKVDWVGAYGLADVASGRKVTPATLFQAASLSKPVAALAALKLVDRGRLSLDEDVNMRLREWKVPADSFTAKRPVTLRELLTHTAGLTVYGYMGYAAGEPLPSLVQVLEGAKPANSPPIVVELEPGTRWEYSSSGYIVMQLLVTEQYGLPFPELMRREVLGPLGMTASTYEQPLPDDLRPLAATGYYAGGKAVEGKYHTIPEMAAGGLWTTPADYARYIMGMLATARGEAAPVLSLAMVDTMLTPGLGGWGLGPQIDGAADSLVFEHGGANPGFRSYFFGAIRSGDGIVVLTNSDAGSQLAGEILRGAGRVYGWPGHQPQVVRPLALAPAALEAFVGSYLVPGGPRAEIRRAGDGLVLAVGGGNGQTLVATGPDTFVAEDSGQRLRFERNASGKVVAANVSGMRVPKLE